MRYTPHEAVDRLLESLLSHLRHIFQERLVGLYLYGSLTTGDFDSDISDIDLLAVTSSKITAREFETLSSMPLPSITQNGATVSMSFTCQCRL